MNQLKKIKWKKIRWFLLGCVPLFFFLRGIHLILTGGGLIAKTKQPCHWILLFLEITIAALAISGCYYKWYKEAYNSEKNTKKKYSNKNSSNRYNIYVHYTFHQGSILVTKFSIIN